MRDMLCKSLFPSPGSAETKTEFRHRSKQVTRLLHHMLTKRHISALKTSSGTMLFSDDEIAQELVHFWVRSHATDAGINR